MINTTILRIYIQTLIPQWGRLIAIGYVFIYPPSHIRQDLVFYLNYNSTMNKLIIVVGLVTSCLNVFAAIGDSYECKTIDIAIINDNQATTNVEPLTFSFAMKHLSLDVESYIGQLSFSQSAIGTLVDNEYGNSLYMDTFDGKERAMASIGTTMAW